MGQAWMIVNHTKKQYIHPHAFGSGYKLAEFAVGGNTITALALLLANPDDNGKGGGDMPSDHEFAGAWCGDQIAYEGEYKDEDQFDCRADDSGYEDVSVKAMEVLLSVESDYIFADLLTAYLLFESQFNSNGTGEMIEKKFKALKGTRFKKVFGSIDEKYWSCSRHADYIRARLV